MNSLSRIVPGLRWVLVICGVVAATALGAAQQLSRAPGTPTPGVGIVPPPDYTIGADDVLTISFWGEKEMSGDVLVRPDGKITLPLINDVVAAGLSPEQLRRQVGKLAEQYFQNVQATVIVKEINSRRVFITGMVEKPGAYPLTTRTTVMQLIALAGGLKEFAKSNRIIVMRKDGARDVHLAFDYEEVLQGKNLSQNVDMKPGDTVVVP